MTSRAAGGQDYFRRPVNAHFPDSSNSGLLRRAEIVLTDGVAIRDVPEKPLMSRLSRIAFFLFILVMESYAFGQSNRGELRLTVTDPSGLGAKRPFRLSARQSISQHSDDQR